MLTSHIHNIYLMGVLIMAKKQAKKKPEVVKEVVSQPRELSQEEFDKLIGDLNEFDNKFYEYLAESPKYEVIPTSDEEGILLTKEQLALVQRECNRLGFKILYMVNDPNAIVMINPKTLKIGYITEGVH